MMKLSSNLLLASALYQAGQINGFPPINGSAFKVAAVREPPVHFALPIALNKTWVNFHLNDTITQAIEIIKEAKAEGVSLIAFPEL